jgi:hypothetical protein
VRLVPPADRFQVLDADQAADRSTWQTAIMTLFRSAAAAISVASPSVVAIGFSRRTW